MAYRCLAPNFSRAKAFAAASTAAGGVGAGIESVTLCTSLTPAAATLSPRGCRYWPRVSSRCQLRRSSFWPSLDTCCPSSVSRSRRSSFGARSEEHTSELQSRLHLVCRLLLEKKKTTITTMPSHLSSGSPPPLLLRRSLPILSPPYRQSSPTQARRSASSFLLWVC